jgi:cellulose synthase/poly-beta-1,6-N-acetylglucosamine synthase-like glycosyltransferase
LIELLQIGFVLPILALAYHYVGFPLLMKFLARKKIQQFYFWLDDELPKIAIILAVYNEEKVIEEKIKSTFDTNYPLDKIEFWIGSDSSTDETDTIIKQYQSLYSQIHFKRFEARTGKPQIINQLVEETDAKLLIMTDANVFFANNTIVKLVSYFKNFKVGLVGGNIINLETKLDGISNQEKAYLNAENMTKYYEGLVFGKMMGAFGGLYAIRRKLYHPVPKGFIVDDFYISMKVLEQGYWNVNALDAVAYEDVSNIAEEEFRRKVRIGIGNFQNLFKFKSLMVKDFYTSFCFLSHKVLRWKGPFLILISWVCTLVLSFVCDFYLYVFLLFTAFLASPLIDGILKKNKIHIKLLRFASHFVSMNLALLIGFIKFASGKHKSTWTPTQRNQ